MTRRLWLSSRCIIIIIIVANVIMIIVVIIINVRNVHFHFVYLSEGNRGRVCCGSQRGGSLLLFRMMTGRMELMMEMLMEMMMKMMLKWIVDRMMAML